MSSASELGFRKSLKLTTFFAKSSSNNYVRRLQDFPEVQNKCAKSGAPDDPESIGWASGIPSGILFKKGAEDYSILKGL